MPLPDWIASKEFWLAAMGGGGAATTLISAIQAIRVKRLENESKEDETKARAGEQADQNRLEELEILINGLLKNQEHQSGRITHLERLLEDQSSIIASQQKMIANLTTANGTLTQKNQALVTEINELKEENNVLKRRVGELESIKKGAHP
jgi:chromosome segregation ATPase